MWKRLLLATSALVVLSGCSSVTRTVASIGETPLSAQEIQAKRAQILKMRDDTLAQLSEQKPEAAAELKKAVGYGVFEAEQVNAILVLGSFGDGVLVDNQNSNTTFVKLDRLGTGPGVGYKSYRQIVIFKNRKLFDQFLSAGGDVSMSADATVKLNGKGGSAIDDTTSFNPLMAVYQFTDQGVLLQANWGGVVYLPDPQLNDQSK